MQCRQWWHSSLPLLLASLVSLHVSLAFNPSWAGTSGGDGMKVTHADARRRASLPNANAMATSGWGGQLGSVAHAAAHAAAEAAVASSDWQTAQGDDISPDELPPPPSAWGETKQKAPVPNALVAQNAPRWGQGGDVDPPIPSAPTVSDWHRGTTNSHVHAQGNPKHSRPQLQEQEERNLMHAAAGSQGRGATRMPPTFSTRAKPSVPRSTSPNGRQRHQTHQEQNINNNAAHGGGSLNSNNNANRDENMRVQKQVGATDKAHDDSCLAAGRGETGAVTKCGYVGDSLMKLLGMTSPGLGITMLNVPVGSGMVIASDPERQVFSLVQFMLEDATERVITSIVLATIGTLRQSHPHDHPLFLDVGANLGFYSVLAARSGASVISIEPQQRCNLLMRMSAAASGVPQELLQQHTALVGDHISTTEQHVLTLPQCDAQAFAVTERKFTHRSDQEKGMMTSVPVVHVDHIIQGRHVALMKIDTEGFDIAAMRSAAQAIEAGHVDTIVVEVVPEFIIARSDDDMESSAFLFKMTERKFDTRVIMTLSDLHGMAGTHVSAIGPHMRSWRQQKISPSHDDSLIVTLVPPGALSAFIRDLFESKMACNLWMQSKNRSVQLIDI